MASQKEEFIKLLNANQGIIYKICNLYANTNEDKKDLEQEIILQLWKSFPNFKGRSKFSTWLYKIAFNTAIANIRKSKKHPVFEAFSGKESNIPYIEDIDYFSDDINKLYKAIAKLKNLDKAIMILYLEKHSYLEISEIIGITEKNVSVRLTRIKVRIKEVIKSF